MAEIAKWGGHAFEVSPSLIKSITELQIRGSSETEDSESGDKYTKRKAGNPKEIRFTVKLNAYVGADVRCEAMVYVDEATAGKKDYLYVSGKKLLPCRMMLTEADVSDVQISPGGTWIRAEVALTMRQADTGTEDQTSQGGGSSSAGSSGGSGWKKETVKPLAARVSSLAGVSMVAMGENGNIKASVKRAQDSIRNLTSNAKAASQGMGGGRNRAVVKTTMMA